MARRPARPARPVTLDTVREIALALPGVEEGTSWGTPSFKLRTKLLARMREDGETLVLAVEPDVRDALIEGKPECFFVTDHYVGYPLVLVRLAAVRPEELRALLEDAWRKHAPKRLVAARAAEANPRAGSTAGRSPRPRARPPRS
jgi:hypothetical protein